MEPVSSLILLKILTPVAVVIFLIAFGVVLLNQHFRQNLNRQLLEKETLKLENQANLLKAILDAQEIERKRIAQDLHDDVGAMLATSKIYVSQLNLEQNLEEQKVLHQKINNLYDLIVTSVRAISHDLRPIILEEFGLTAAIQSFHPKLESASIRFGFTINQEFYFKSEAEIHIYRIVCELISNTLKHAIASTITLSIEDANTNIHLVYIDNGIGFPEKQPSRGLGMKGIESRVSLLKGSFEILKAEKGINFQIFLPKSIVLKDESD